MTWTMYGCLILGSQYICPREEDYEKLGYHIGHQHNANILFHIANFIFYLSWVTVAEIMLNPFGDDPDDFELNYMIDRNLQTSFQIVDGNPKDFPSLEARCPGGYSQIF